MHELSIAMEIVDIVGTEVEKNGGKNVEELELEIGEMAGIVFEALDFALEEAVKGSILEKADIKILKTPGKAQCQDCGKKYYVTDFFSLCPECNSPRSEIIQGKELKVKSIKIKETI